MPASTRSEVSVSCAIARIVVAFLNLSPPDLQLALTKAAVRCSATTRPCESTCTLTVLVCMSALNAVSFALTCCEQAFLLLIRHIFRQSVRGELEAKAPSARAHGRKAIPVYLRRLRKAILTRFQSTVSGEKATALEFFSNFALPFFSALTFASTLAIDLTSAHSTDATRNSPNQQISSLTS